MNEIKRTFEIQAQHLDAKGALISRGTFNEGLFRQRNPSLNNWDKQKLIKLLAHCTIERRRSIAYMNFEDWVNSDGEQRT